MVMSIIKPAVAGIGRHLLVSARVVKMLLREGSWGLHAALMLLPLEEVAHATASLSAKSNSKKSRCLLSC